MSKKTDTYAGYRYPAELIRHAVGPYFRFTLSFRDVEEILAYRGLPQGVYSGRPFRYRADETLSPSQ